VAAEVWTRPLASVTGTRLEFESRERAHAVDRGHRLLDAAEPGLAYVERLEAPTLARGVAFVHAEQHGREQGRLLAAGSGAHLEDDVARIGLVLGQQHELHRALGRGQAFLEAAVFLVGEGAHLGVGGRIVAQLRRLLDPVLEGAKMLDRVDHRIEFGHLLG